MSVFLGVFLPLLLAYADTLKWIWDRWLQEDSYYSHGPLLPLVAWYVIHTRRQELRRGSEPGSDAPDPRGWWLLGTGLFLRLAGAAQMVDSLSAVSLLLSLAGAVYLCLGRRRFRVLLPVLVLLVFAAPLPMDMTGRCAFELKELAVDWAVGLGNAMGLGAVRQEARLSLPGQMQTLEVADACSGLRSLLALTALGYCLAFFLGSPHWLRRTVILLVTVPLAVATNVLRILGLCFLAKEKGVAFAGGTGHDLVNLLAWGVNLALLLLLDAVLLRSLGKEGRS